MNALSVYSPGSPVLVGGSIPATVAQVSLSPGGHIAYQVVWYDGRTRTIQWVEAFEVGLAEGSQAATIGFLPEGSSP